MGNYPYTEVKYFRGLTKSKDVFNALTGQLSKNENYMYMANGGLEERGGGLLLTENPNFSYFILFYAAYAYVCH